MQRSIADRRLRVDVGAGLEQDLEHGGCWVGLSSEVQRSGAFLVLRIDVRASLEQDLERGG